MVNEFKLTVVYVAHPIQTRCRSVRVRGVTAGQKKLWKNGTAADHRAVGLLLAKPQRAWLIQECLRYSP